MTLTPREKCTELVNRLILDLGLYMLTTTDAERIAKSLAEFTGNEVGEATAALRRQVEELRQALETIAGTLDAIAETIDGKPYHIIKAAIRSQAKQARAGLDSEEVTE